MRGVWYNFGKELIFMDKNRPAFLRLGYWKQYLRLSPVLRPMFWSSVSAARKWRAEFGEEFQLLFDNFKFGGDFGPFASDNSHWKGIFQGRAAPSDICEIGSYHGSSAVLFAHLFPNAHITCIDNWQGIERWCEAEEFFDSNTAAFSSRVHKIKSDSVSALSLLRSQGKKFDVIYVDGSHFEDDVLVDTILAWRLLRIGGVMIWDDYRWRYAPFRGKVPKRAIDHFIARHSEELRPLYVDGQVFAEKTAEFDSHDPLYVDG